MTKTLSSKPATTKQLKDVEKRLRQEMRDTAAKLAIKKDPTKFVKYLSDVFWTKQDMQQYIEETERKAQKRHDEYITMMDRRLTEIENSRRDELFHRNRLMRLEKTLADHEKRLCVLEAKGQKV